MHSLVAVAVRKTQGTEPLRENDAISTTQLSTAGDAGLKRIGEQMAKSRIVIVGGGFAGLAAAKALGKTPAKVILIDRTKSPPVSAVALPGGNICADSQSDCDPNTQHIAQPKEHHGAFGESLEWT